MMPPNEKPARSSGAGAGTRRSMASATASARASAVCGAASMSESPKPGMSAAYTRARRASEGMFRIQCAQEPLAP